MTGTCGEKALRDVALTRPDEKLGVLRRGWQPERAGLPPVEQVKSEPTAALAAILMTFATQATGGLQPAERAQVDMLLGR